jgi:hypothetical protein
MRRSARNQPLPKSEQELLKTLTGLDLKIRCRDLFEAGWTLSAIGEPLDKQRSTIRFWVTNAPNIPVKHSRALPIPEDKSYVPRKPPSPGISDTTKARLAELAPLARRYRARMASTHQCSVANNELSELSKTLHAIHVPIQEIADAAGVTYRAMYRRIHQR